MLLNKKLLVLVTLVIFVVGSLNAETLVLVAADSPPTAYFENGKLTGILVDIVSEAFRRMGVSIEIRLLPWARCLAAVHNGDVDGIFSVFKLPEREAFLSYTEIPIIVQVESLFVRSTQSIAFSGDISQLSSYRIGIIRATSYGATLDAAINRGLWKNVQLANNAEGLFEMLIYGRVDIAPSYRHIFLSLAKRSGDLGKIKELLPSLDAVPSFLAFTKQRNYSKIIAEFNSVLKIMKQDGTFAAINAKYIPNN